MAKIVVANLNPRGKSAGRRASVSEKRIRDSSGRTKTLRTIDAESCSFGEDLRYVFEQNVRKARRDNKRLTGSADFGVKR